MMLLELIINVISEKEAAGIAPAHALVFKDIITKMPADRHRIEKELKELEAAGMIRIGNTINDRYINLKNT